MAVAIEILRYVFNTSATFFASAGALMFLYCFCDSNYRWTMKKGLCIVALSVLDTILMLVLDNDLWYMLPAFIVSVLIAYVAVYDYQGGKLWAGVRYYFITTILTLTPTTLCDTACVLISPEILDSALLTEEQMAAMTEAEALAAQMELASSYSVPNWVYLVSFAVTTVFFGFVFFYLYYKIYKPQIAMRCNSLHLLFAGLYPLVSYGFVEILIVIRHLTREDSIVVAVLTCTSLFLGLLIPMVFYYTRINHYYRERTALQENYMQSQISHFIEYKQTQEETARFRHDIRNHLQCVNNLLLEGNTAEATQYLHEILNVSSTLSPRYVSGDEMLDSIISAKTGLMKVYDIPFRLDGVIAGGLPWKPMDICTVFANALDNAIEACQQLPVQHRAISMQIKSTPQCWYISIQNPTARYVDTTKLFRKGGGYTSKANAPQHGMGTYSMKHAVESYGGILKAECEHNLFSLEIVIYRTEQ